ncbi:sensor histidine kinase YesM [Luteibacter sp. Sphag1AF]|uniref:sensor histidine kinase n=1 Tax=Luteibacter sp. Sphag1AF TaxID=2587031 RepID=UPI00161FE721|nr:histidine kinase [Luteibacter sp. Sphag1AF]MBB3228243.1 sensor histidine kinase YesM [Luteibacter sp. Sphag1AF]
MKVRLGSTDIGLARYIGLWTLVVVVFAFQRHLQDKLTGMGWHAVDYLRWSMIQWYTWAALAPLVFRLAARYPLQSGVTFRQLRAPLAAGVAITLLSIFIGAVVSTIFEPSSLAEQLRQFMGQHFATGMLTYGSLFAIAQALQFHAEKTRREIEASRMATELVQSRLQALKSQLQPHFLFNTLHAIATLLKEDALSAEDMLLRLSDLLRAFLEDYDGQEIPLRRELVLLDLYLGIQQMRFKDRLTTRIYIAPDVLDCAVPSLILQPIVENAIQHGISERVGPDCVEVEARRDGDSLCIEVRNRNSSLEGEGSGRRGHRVGLTNTRLRLQELYGDLGQVRLDVTWPEGVACRIRLPLRNMSELDDSPEIVNT